MNGGMAEAESGCAILEDEDKDTFHRFAQWLYTASYSAAKPSKDDSKAGPSLKICNTETAIGTDELLKPARANGGVILENLHRTPIRKRARKSKSNFLSQFENLDYLLACTKQDVNEDHTEVFLSHARLYVSADKYDIPDLKDLSRSQLASSLKSFRLYPERTKDIFSLVRYVYANVRDSSTEAKQPKVLLVQYLKQEMDTLMDDDDFGVLLADIGGSLMKDFMKIMKERTGQSSSTWDTRWLAHHEKPSWSD